MGKKVICSQEGWNLLGTSGCVKTAPGPIGGFLDQIRLNRVVHDVSAVFQELLLLLDQPCLIPALENRSRALVLPVVELTVKLIEKLHPFRQIWVGRLN